MLQTAGTGPAICPVKTALAGYAWMALAVLIWASWLVLTSSGQTTALSVIDLAGFRATIPAIVLAPLLWRERQTIAQLGAMRCLLLSLYGAPFTVLVGFGLTHAPVAHAAAMVPGLMPVFAVALSRVILREPLRGRQGLAASLILAGAMTIMLQGTGEAGVDYHWVGHVLFLSGALCWASFTVTLRASEIPPFLATAIVGALSTIALVPVWILSGQSNLDTAGFTDIAFQAAFQGVISGLVSMFAFGRALRLIGGQAAAFSALTPGVAAVLAIAVLGQMPSFFDALALGLVVIGLIIRASGPPADQTDPQSTQNGRQI